MARFVTIICTRCGKTNEVSYTGHRIKIRCVGCGHSVTVGGRAAGLKSLPLQEIGIAIGILFLIGLGFAVYSFFIVERDPLQEHREKVREAAKAVVLAAKAPEWHDVSFRYVVTVFNDFQDPTVAWVRIGYLYREKANEPPQQIEFPMKFRREGDGINTPFQWKPECLGFFSRSKLKKLRDIAEFAASSGSKGPPKYNRADFITPREKGCVDDSLPASADWLKYVFLEYDPKAHVDWIRGRAYRMKKFRQRGTKPAP